MTKKITMISLLMLLLCSGYLSAQWAGKPVRFAAETTYFPGNFEQIMHSPAITGPEDVVEGRFVRFIQTETILNADQRSRAEALGVRFHGYVQFGAYLTSFPAGFDFSLLQTLPIRSVVPVKTAWKMAQSLKDRPFGEWAKRGDQIEIYLQVYPHVSVAKGAELCRRYGLDVLKQGRMNGILRVLISPDNLENIAALPFVRSMELISPPAEKEDIRGRSLLRSNMLDGDHSASLKFNGDGVKTLVRDDGRLGPHIDFQGRLHNMADGDEFAGTHGDGVGGIIGGAGNLDPYMKGMAAGADVYTLDYVDDFQDETMDLFFDENVTLTNSSYSNGCNLGYTTITQTVDQQLFDNPTLMHVFSAGNANSSDCGYGAGTQFGNITGGHKAAKNSIATANLKQDGTLDTTSSRGPVHDGRLKPDISANGNGHYSTDPDNGYQEFGGTSGASPCIVGILAQLSQAYKSYHNGEDPRTDLLKAAIMNTATDIGPVGPDWRFGYGQVNAGRAHSLIKQQRYAFAQIDQGATNTQTLNVPNNTRAVKVMIYWAEPAADVSTTRALINDLDLTITSASGVVHLPWKLDPTPDPAILNMQAGRGRDSLNNCEQVVIEMPASGAYTIRVSGTEVPMGPQSYVLVWELVEPGPTITYPNGGEGLVPGETARIHWDAYGADGNFTLRYSVDGGNTFQNITTITNAKQRMYDWTVPNITSGEVRMMVIRNNRRDTSDQNLSIVRVPQNVHILKVCPDSMTVAWNEVLDTLSYDVYALGQKYMEIQGRSDTTWLTFPINDASVERWISVRAAHENGMTGRRAIAIKSPGYIKNCPQPEDLNLAALIAPSGDAIISCSATEQDITVKLRNDGLNPANGITINYQANGGAVVSEILPDMASGDSIEYTFITPLALTQGSVVDLQVWATFPADDVSYNDTIRLSFPTIVGSIDQPFIEPLDATNLPAGWAVVNPDDDATWELVNIPVGANGMPTRALFMDHYNYGPEIDQEDYFYMKPVDLGAFTNPFLKFDLSHVHYSDTYSDSMRVEVFENCDLSIQPVTIWGRAGLALATAGTSTTQFTPDNQNDWANQTIDMTQFAGQTVIVRFVSHNGYGNSLYLDNVGIKNVVVAAPVASITTAADSVCRNVNTFFEAGYNEDASYSWVFGASSTPSSATGIGPHTVKYLNSGIKTVRLIVTNAFGSDTITQQITVLNNAAANFTSANNQLTVNFTNTSTNALDYSWDFGDGNTSTDVNPTHTYAAAGTYSVKLTANNQCNSSVKTIPVTLTTDVKDLANLAKISLSPNPTSGDFRIDIKSEEALGEAQFNLLDAAGRLVKTVGATLHQGDNTVRFEGLELPKGVYQVQIRSEKGLHTVSLTVI